jgi:MSHA biogenesis protein MshK
MFGSLNAKTLVDPTRPSAYAAQKKGAVQNVKPEFVLNAVFINDKNKYAVINGQNYQEGQDVLGKRLILVTQNHVVLDAKTGKKTLFLNNDSIKKDINNGF